MNKNNKSLFFVLTLILLFVSLGVISAIDTNDTTTLSDDTITNNPDITNNQILKEVKTQNKDQNKQIKKEVVTSTQTANNYDTLKTSWNNIQDNGNETTQYTINIKNGNYKFTEQLTANITSNTKYITINGEDADKTIFNGQNTTRFFNLNNPNQVIKFNNITFTNGFNDTQSGAIYSNAIVEINNTKFINNTVYNTQAKSLYGGAISTNNNLTITNSIFNNNSIKLDGKNNYVYGGAIYIDETSYKALNITDSEFNNNHINAQYGYGGAICADYKLFKDSSILNIIACGFNNNYITGTTSYGGAISIQSTYIDNRIISCDFNNNSINNIGSTSSVSNDIRNGNPNYCFFNTTNGKSMYSYNGKNNNYYLYKSYDKAPEIFFLANEEVVPHIFNQKVNNITLKLYKYDDYYYAGASDFIIGRNKTFTVTSSSDLINTTDIILSPENNYTAIINISNLPVKHEDISLKLGGVEFATVVYNYTNINIDDIISKAGKTITIKATLISNSGRVVNDGRVAIKINGKTIGHTNVKFGKIAFNYTIPSNYSSKNYTINFVYGGNYQFIEARKNATLQLIKSNTKTDLTTTIDGNTLKINVNPTDENNNTVNHGKICVKIEGKTLQNLKINGKIQVNFTIPKSWNNRKIRVLAIYGENNQYHTSRTEITTKLTLPLLKKLKKEDITNNYYVSDATGSDSNTGSQTSPFKTIQKAINTINTNKHSVNVYLDGQFKGLGNTNLTVPGNLHINFIGIGNSTIDGEVNYTMGGKDYYWESGLMWEPYSGSGNWAMNITKGNGLITISNFTIKNCWSDGGSSISAYKTATIDNYGNLEVNNVSFIYNHAGIGAGIRNNNGANLNVTNSFFEANRKSSSTGNDGAGVYNNGTCIIINSTFQKNYARWGTITNDKNLTIINSTLRDNIAYDGMSTYKTGAGINVNTGRNNFYETYEIPDCTTLIDGCTFINNDQSDIYVDYSSVTIVNNVLNRSTGIYIREGYGNLTTNIINNTIDSPIVSKLGSSLSNSDPKTVVTFNLIGNFNYNIDSNRVLNVGGNTSNALYLKNGNSNITNNNFTRMIIVGGSNNIIRGNNITTVMDKYAINISDGNNIITDNYLLSTFKGNTAINYTFTSNIVENNTPEVSELQIDDKSFYKYFDDDGNLLDSYNLVNQIQIIDSLNNKDINFNQKIKLIQNGNFTSNNITITTTHELEMISFKIINENQKPVVILNSNNNKITSSNLTTDNPYTIIINNTKNNTISTNILIADIKLGNESVQCNNIADNNIELNTPTYKRYLITDETYNQIFNDDGTIKTTYETDEIYLLFGDLYNKIFLLNNNKTFIINNYHQIETKNITIKTEDNTKLNLTNIIITNTNNKPVLELKSSSSKIYNSTLKSNGHVIIAENTNLTNITNSIIIKNSTNNDEVILINNSYELRLLNNTIDTISSTTQNGIFSAISGYDLTYIWMTNNTITTNYIGNNSNIQVYSINLENSIRKTSIFNNLIESNIITTNANDKACGLNIINYTIQTVSNTITTNAKTSVGINITTSNINTTQTFGGSNSITSNSKQNNTGIILNSCTNSILTYITYVFDCENTIGIKLVNTTNTTVGIRNDMKLNCKNTIAIKVEDSNKINISSNYITTYSKVDIAPIIISNSTEILTYANTIYTDATYAIKIDEKTSKTLIRQNTLYAKYIGDKAVEKLGKDQVVVIENKLNELDMDYKLNNETFNNFFDENGLMKEEVPEGVNITITESLRNKVMIINKPVTITSITIYNTTIILTENASYTNITGFTINGTENVKLVVNASNCNIVGTINYENYKILDDPFIVINGNNNYVHITAIIKNYEVQNMTICVVNGNYNRIQGNIRAYGMNNSNVTQIIIKGHDNDIKTIAYAYDFINSTNILFKNTSNNIVNASDLYGQNNIILINAYNNQILSNTLGASQGNDNNKYNAIILTNSNNNLINIRNMEFRLIGDINGITLRNSSYNKILGNKITSYNDVTVIKLENNSNYNIIEKLGFYHNTPTKNIPIYIENSNYNKIYANNFSYAKVNNYAIRIIESLENNVTYNMIETLFYDGNDAIKQESVNETISNLIRYNVKNSRSLNQTRINVTIPSSVKVYDTIRINTSVEVRSGRIYKLVSTGHIKFKINGKEVEVVDLIGGLAEINYTVKPTDGEFLFVEVTYEDPALIGRLSIRNRTLNIQKLDSTIIMANHTSIGSQTNITSIIIDEMGNIVYDGNVSFKVDNKTIGSVEIRNGIAQIIVNTQNYKLGVHNLSAEFSGNNICSNATTISTFTVVKMDVNLVVDSVVVSSGNNAILTAKITDVNGNPVNGGRVIFKLNGRTLKDADGNTIYANVVGGVSTINYMIPTDYTSKDYILTAVLSDAKYNRVEANTTLTITKTTPKIQIPTKLIRSNNTTFTINIIDENGNKINSNQKVCLKFNGCTIINTKTVNGTVTLNLDLTKYKNPQYEMTLICGENSKYNKCINTTILAIE